MDSREIRELIELVSRSNFRAFELEHEGFRLRLIKERLAQPTSAPQPAAQPHAAVGAERAETPAQPPPPARPPEAPAGDGLLALNSPIVGTFYRSSGPDAPPFVEVGSRVKKGQTVCIVEAMKVMNEIESEFDGEVIEVAVTNGQPVEYGEVLFRLRPL